MLEEKLRQASQTHTKKSKRMLSMFAIAALAIALFTTAMLLFDFNTSPSTPKAAVAVTTSTPANTSKLREQFIKKLHLYEDDIVPALADA
ncbi:MAG: hypothetical protein Q9M08_06460, partial [Mariprofundus sp.]|nr:hypothetical protein [Mariprofundus sp.]